MDLLHRVEAVGGMPGQHACEARREAGAHDDAEVALPRFGVEGQQGAYVGQPVTHRHHVGSMLEGSLRSWEVPLGLGQDGHVGAGQRRAVDRARLRRRPERRDHGRRPAGIAIDDDQALHATAGQQLAGGTPANRSSADEDDVHAGAALRRTRDDDATIGGPGRTAPASRRSVAGRHRSPGGAGCRR